METGNFKVHYRIVILIHLYPVDLVKLFNKRLRHARFGSLGTKFFY